MAATARQFNAPQKMYSAENVNDTLTKQTQMLPNGALGIDFSQLTAHAPGNLANSAVLRMLEEEARSGGKENSRFERTTPRRRVQCFDWPPKGPDNDVIDNDDVKANNNLNNINNLNNVKHVNNLNKLNLNNSWNGLRNVNRTYPFNTTTCQTYTSPGLKRIAWPPLPETQTNIIEQTLVPVYTEDPVYSSPPNTTTNINTNTTTNTAAAPPISPPTYQRTVQAPAPVLEPPPSYVTLRSTAPISQETAPVFESQPAATRALGPRMRGDQKWPPAEQKAQAVEENAQRVALAKGPAVRPRAVKKDYSKFFAQHALTATYPGYRAPPGTQHYVEEGTSNF